jgi:hypothetical protein
MCIAVYIPAGVKPPSKATFQRCFKSNDDGAGFGWYDSKKKLWEVWKGHMTFGAFWKAFREMNLDRKANSMPVVCHFRIGTSGKKEHPDCTHPFPVCDDYELMTRHRFAVPNIAIHNGVLGSGDGDASDTMVWIKKYVNPMLPYIKSNRMGEILGELIEDKSSRWLVTKRDEVLLYGAWTENENGVSFSNDGYKSFEEMYPHGTSYRRPAWAGRDGGYQDPSNPYDWMPKKVEMVHTIYRFSDYTLSGEWCWAKFETYIQERNRQTSLIAENMAVLNSDDGSAASTSASEITSEEDKVWEIYDADQNVLGVVDNNGDILWDEVKEDRYQAQLEVQCISCGDKQNLVASPFSQGDYLCCRCGAVFCRNQKKVIMWDINTRKEWDETQKALEGDK